MNMRSNRPYLLRAFYDWIVDNDCTPYIVVDAHYPEVQVPQDFVTDGQIVLNIAPRAVSSFEMNQYVQLSTRFGYAHRYLCARRCGYGHLRPGKWSGYGV